VAYQEKTIEFNKRFINPWIRLGNVFDKQDRNEEAICAYQKAIEIDPNNAQNWYELGNIHFRMEKYDEAVDDFNHAIDLDPGFGSPYSNLALTLVTQGKYVQAIPLYRKGIELLDEDKDRAVAWNRLGNLYRKLNEYELAIESFQKADELDQENAGFRDNLDDVPDGPTVVEADGDGEEPAIPVAPNLSDLVTADGQAADAVSDNTDETAPVQDASAEAPTQPDQAIADNTDETPAAQDVSAEASTQPDQAVADNTDSTSDSSSEAVVEVENTASDDQPAKVEAHADQTTDDAVSEPSVQPEAEQPVLENAVEVTDGSTVDAAVASTDVDAASADPIADDAPEAVAETGTADKSDETVTVVVQSTIETFTETVTVSDTTTETSDATLTVETTEEVVDGSETAVENVVVDEVVAENTESIGSNQVSEPAPVDGSATTSEETSPAAPVSEEAAGLTPEASEGQVETVDAVATQASRVEVAAEAIVEAALDQATDSVAETTEPPAIDQPAYEEYLKDSNDPIHIYQTEATDQALETENTEASQGPVAKINNQGELQIEMDTKNAHVWNELGNVYFNTGAFDDAVVAYSKAIELDRWFAWPYSNLALTYVQKGRFVEAILLYQRSIELFKSDKDKAVSWNRLGNVYRRINDYENAIASYQRADELDPDNTTLSLQSRFSLLGNYVMEQKATYVS